MIVPLLLSLAAIQWLAVAAVQIVTVPFGQLTYPAGNWTQYSDLSALNCTGGAAISFGVVGATATYQFFGIAVSLDFITASDGANLEVTLDGNVTTLVTRSAAITCDVLLFNQTGLDYTKQHTISFRTIEANSVGFRQLIYTTYTPAEASAQSSIAVASASAASAASVASISSASAASASASQQAAQQQSDHNKSTRNAIIGGVIGGIAGLILIGLLIFFALRRGKQNQPPPATNQAQNQNQFTPQYGQPQQFVSPQPTPGMQQYNHTGYSATSPTSANWGQQPMYNQPGFNPAAMGGSPDPSNRGSEYYNPGYPAPAPGMGGGPPMSNLPEPMAPERYR